MDTKTLTDILQSFQEDLPDHSQTATAIDQGASLADIANQAQAEGLHEIATVLFEAQQEAFQESPEATTDPGSSPKHSSGTFARGYPTAVRPPPPSIATRRGKKFRVRRSRRHPPTRRCVVKPRTGILARFNLRRVSGG